MIFHKNETEKYRVCGQTWLWHDLQTLNATGTVGLGVDPEKMGVQFPIGNDGRALWALHLLAKLELLLVPTGVSQV